MEAEERASIIASHSPMGFNGRAPHRVREEAIKQIREAEQAMKERATEIHAGLSCVRCIECKCYLETRTKIREL